MHDEIVVECEEGDVDAPAGVRESEARDSA
jgi:hypothetical protein